MDTGSLVQPGRQFAVFERDEELAGALEVGDRPKFRGGYADVYHGFWTNPRGERIEVAVKELKALIPRNQQTTQAELTRRAEMRIAREAFVWSRVEHRNLHPFLGYRSQPEARLISPWCHHGSLLDYVQANPSLSRSDKLTLIYQAAYGLEHLHSRTPPICHADIKPENVLINNLREAALSDFGLSRVLHGPDIPSGFTTSDTPKGTFRYKARELFCGGQPTCQSDVYAFGGLILTVMSGYPPFISLRESTILSRVMNNQPPQPEDHPGLPDVDPLWNLMRRCWDPNPAARPTMRDVVWELWGQISPEMSDLPARSGSRSVADTGVGEDWAMDLDISDTVPAEGGSSATATGPAPVPGFATEGTCSLAARGIFSPALGILRRLELSSKTIPVFGRYIRAATEVGFQLMEIVKTIDRNQNVANALDSNAWKLAIFLDELRKGLSGRGEEEIAACISDVKGHVKRLFEQSYRHANTVHRQLQSVQREFNALYSSRHFPGALSCCDHEAGRKQWEGAALNTWEAMQMLVNLNTATLIDELQNNHLQEERRRLLNCLGDGKYGALGNAIDDAVCLPGTRVQILERTHNWIRDTSTTSRVLWIRGMAGRGKSTLASTVAHSWQYRATCAIFHFRRGQDAVNRRIVCALARQLGNSLVPEVRNAVLESVRENEDIADQRLSVQFETLFIGPLSTLQDPSHIILIVVDALDECSNSKDAEDFVKLIDRHSSSLPINIKFLLTCRPEVPLLRTLEPRTWQVENLDSSPDVIDDLARFFKQAFKQIREEHGLSPDWPSHSDVDQLVEMSQGLFQWARTATTYIGSRSPDHRLRELLKRASMWSGLDDLYHQILSKAFDNSGLDSPRRELLSQILGILVVAPYPVSIEVIATLLWSVKGSIFEDENEDHFAQFLCQDILADLHSLLLIPASSSEALCLMHTSIRDLLISQQRCSDRAYYTDMKRHHKQLAGMCLDLMVRCLKENICNLSDISTPNSEIQDIVDREVSTSLRYCCRAWSIHLTEGTQWSELRRDGASSLQADFQIFSKEKVLYWLEVMSVTGATSEAMIAAKRMHQWLSQFPTEMCNSSALENLWNDTHRFIAAFSEPISFGALHIYVSALTHCPQMTKFWEWYGKHAKMRTMRGVQPLTWPRYLWVASDGGSDATVVAFLPDGSTLACGFLDGTIRLWDTQTGTPLGEPLRGHSNRVTSVAVSPDSRILASGSWDGTVQLWDPQTGVLLGEVLKFDYGVVESVAFSPDGKVLASGFKDGTIRLWDAQAWTPMGEPLFGQNGLIESVAFSLDSKVLASGAQGGTIQLWDLQAGVPLGGPLTVDHGKINFVVFSPDRKVLASGFKDGTIRLCDAQAWTPMGEPLSSQNRELYSVAFSPDNKVLASGAEDGAIQLWNIQSGTPLGEPLTGHTDGVFAIAFSPDGKCLASAAWDYTIRLWDLHTGARPGEPHTSYDDSPSAGTFLPDSTIRLWDVPTGPPPGESSTGDESPIRCIALSPDGNVLASGHGDHTIRLWNAQNPTHLGEPLGGHNGEVRSVAISPDNRILASGSFDKTVRLWDLHTRAPLGKPLTGHDRAIASVTFSPDGTILASGSDKILLWNALTDMPLREPLKPATRNGDMLRCIVFSPDGNVMASRSADDIITLWDARTWMPFGNLPASSLWSEVNSIAFSRDGKILASTSPEGITRLWDVNTREPYTEPETGCITNAPFSQAVPRGVPCNLLHYHNHWVVSCSSRLFWLPAQYWGADDGNPTILLSNQRFAVHYKGQLSVFHTSDGLLDGYPRWTRFAEVT